MESITIIDRATGRLITEKVYGENALRFLYGSGFLSRWIGRPVASCVSRCSFISALYGYFQKRPASRKKIAPFVRDFDVDTSEFLEGVESFNSFNDFFIRKLKPEARPLAPGANIAVLPADARYLFYPNIDQADGFVVKGRKFNLRDLLQNVLLAERYAQGTLIMARLCPSDYHRFHFPCDCIPGESQPISGALFSVNPIALKQKVQIFTENRRVLCELETEHFGKILYMEVGATNVGTIHETYTPLKKYYKGEEKGYFSFGGSALILLFEPGKIQLDADLLGHGHTEIRGLMGQSLGVKGT